MLISDTRWRGSGPFVEAEAQVTQDADQVECAKESIDCGASQIVQQDPSCKLAQDRAHIRGDRLVQGHGHADQGRFHLFCDIMHEFDQEDAVDDSL